MKLTNRLISHALTLVLLLGLGVLVFHRSGLKQPFSRNAPGSAGASAQQAGAQQITARQTAARERPFRVEGVALVDATWPTGPSGVELRPSKCSDSGAMVEPTSRVLSIDGNATELGAFQGILQDAKFQSDCRIGALMIHVGDRDAMRLILKLEPGPAGGFSGTYRVLGGTGKFERAAGDGSYRDAPTAVKQSETVSIALEGTISY